MDQTSRNEAIVAGARQYLGCKWRHRGRSEFGIDCIGLIVRAMAAGGIEMRDRLDYSRTPYQDGLDRELAEHFGVPLADLRDLQPADVVLMRWDRDPEPSHVGLIASNAGGLTLIHAYSMISVTEHNLSPEWVRRIVKAYRP